MKQNFYLWGYRLLLAIAAPFLLYRLYQKKPGKPTFEGRWREHFGRCAPLSAPTTRQGVIWVHAASVGEVLAITPLIKAFKAQYPQQALLLTTTTSTGAAQAKLLGDLVTHRYCPLDFNFAIKGFLRRVQPRALWIVETELWPNTLLQCHRAGIPCTLLNGRLSQKSFANYRKVQPLFSLFSQGLKQIICQNQQDAQYFLQLGIPTDQLAVCGSIKFDIHITDEILKQGDLIRQQIGNDRPVWLAASTHAGEDEILLAIHQQVCQSHPHALLIIVPRHPERFDDVAQICQDAQLQLQRRSSLDAQIDSSTQVYLADTMGEMLRLMQASDLCFIAGSLIGNKKGGHNPIEAAALGKPLITGPSYFNFTQIMQALAAAGGLLIMETNSECIQHIQHMFDAPNKRQQIAALNRTFVQSHQGAIQKSIDILAKTL